jgi:amino acid transporter
MRLQDPRILVKVLLRLPVLIIRVISHKKEVGMTDVAERSEGAPSEHRLNSGVLGLFDSAIMGIAGSAPAYSIGATTGALFFAVRYGGEAALLYCGFFMFGIVWAFSYLSRDDSHAGAAYSWVRRAIHPILGYLSGWALIVSALLFMVIATFPAGSSVLRLFSASLSQRTGLVTLFGAVFFFAMVLAVALGVTVTVKVQIIMSTVEVFLLLLFAGLALFHAHHATPFTWHWFSPSIFTARHSQGFVAGALIAAFYYWGWDVTANLNEETKDAKRTSGLGGLLGTFVVFLLFEVFTIASNMVLPTKELANPGNVADFMYNLGQAVWHGLGGKLLIVALLLSTIATLETTLIQVTRTLFTMGRDQTLPKILGTTHPMRKTPFVATMTVTVLSLGLFVASQYVGSVANILNDGYTAIAIQICIYYSLAGISVVILYRRQLFKSANNFIFIGLWPLLGAVFMGFLFVKSIPELNHVELIVGLGSMALGFIPMAWYWYKGAPYFKMPDKLDRHAQLLELQQMEELL